MSGKGSGSPLAVWTASLTSCAVVLLRTQEGIDVFKALDLMENSTVLTKLKFGPGDGLLHYYLFNYQTPFIKPNELGLILLEKH